MRLAQPYHPVLICLLCLLGATSFYAQQVELTGTLKDSLTQEPVIGATIVAQPLDSMRSPAGCISNEQGQFRLPLAKGNYQIQLSHVGYQSFQFPLKVDSSLQLGILYLGEHTLDAINVEAQQVAILQKGDTTVFNAGAFKTRANGSARDLLRKMPGMETDGDIKAQGEEVAEVLVDGEPFGSQNKGEVLDNLPATIVDKVEVYKHQSEEANMSGIETNSNQKTVNIVTKKKYRTSVFGEGQVAGGSSMELLPVYFSELRFNSMQHKRRWNLELESANIRGTKIELQNEQRNPHNKLAASFNDHWGKSSLNLSYSLNHQQQNNKTFRDKSYVFIDSLGKYIEEEEVKKHRTIGHFARIQFRHVAKKHRFTANGMFRQNTGRHEGNQMVAIMDQNRQLGRSTYQEQFSQSKRWNYQLNLMYNARFEKKGRGLTISVGGSNQQQTDSTQQLIQRYEFATLEDRLNQRIENRLDNHNFRTQLSYTEPLGEYGQLQLQTNWNYQLSQQRKLNYASLPLQGRAEQLDSTLSTISNQQDNTIQLAPAYQFAKKKINFRVGTNWMWQQLDFTEQLDDNTTDLNYLRVQPQLQFRWQAEPMAFAMFRYQMTIRNPSLREQQAVLDNSNPVNLYRGNPNLKQEALHLFLLNWNKNNISKNRTFTAQLQAQWQQNRIEQGLYTFSRDTSIFGVELKPGIQLFVPVNVGGSYNINSSLNWTQQLKFIPSNLHFFLFGSYAQNPTIFNGKRENSQQWNTAITLKWTSNISEHLDINISSGTNLSSLISASSSSIIWQQHLSLHQYWSPFKRFFIENHLQQQYTSSTKELILNWNAGIGYNLFKKEQGELQISMYNILNQNGTRSIVTTATYNEVNQNQNLLGRYFLLKFVYHLQPTPLKKNEN